MSYDIRLKDPVTKETILFDSEHHMRGGTFRCGGTKEARLNVTYNYFPHFQGLGKKGIRTIYGMTAADSIPLLQGLAGKLDDDIDSDYWKPTEGNAKHALLQLIALAKMRPDGVWGGD